MEEKLSDKVCEKAFREFYINKNYKISLAESKKVYRLISKSDTKDYKDIYYIWMILITIIKSYKELNQLDKALKYILLALRYAEEEYKKIESYILLIQCYIIRRDLNKSHYYLGKLIECCNRIGEYQILSRIIDEYEL